MLRRCIEEGLCLVPVQIRTLIAAAALALLAAPAMADTPNDPDVYVLTIRNHQFEPVELVVPAGRKVRLQVVNADPTPEEFESHELNREKVIPGNTTGVVYVGPLDAGTYPFFGDFNPGTAQGRLVAK